MRVNPKDSIFRLKVNNERVRQTARDLGMSPGTVLYWKRRASTGNADKRWRYSTHRLVRKSTEKMMSLF